MINVFNIIIGLFVFFILWALIEAQVYRVRRIKIKNGKIPKGFNNFKIIFISDMHYGRGFSSKRLINIVNKINKIEPDIIIIGGDYLDISVKSKRDVSKYLEKELQVLKKLKAKLGIFTVLGNHDYFKGKDYLVKKLNSNSFKILKNGKELISMGGDTIELIGVDDLLEGNPEANLLKETSDNFTIAISHNPDFFSDYKNVINYDLGFAGHTHGGQVTIFGLYAPYTSSKYGQMYCKKIIHEENRDILLTNGIGNGMLPIRFFAIPEIVEIDLEV
ncbi:metallophosphoesterase [Clostridium estertheticum]|uniref:metallophosphoesterase n=1 Tax=Clostridium estertheticum TaxID=238834 RepID=UPI001C7CE956|nr:metallophosphoesterase [Clostridium estertheticum]MBX4261115.1 metallophosphoesterase [Clostridium estertheticum]WLC71947.1 metallophosphoesterase [Clostridium estertheticum]